MSGDLSGGAADGFAELLRELKDRSGLSYGTLAKRLHMSTSTLHRYCNGTAVPNEYAPVERFARACRAAPEELVELHRRWILADAARTRKGEPVPVPEPPAAEESGGGESGADDAGEPLVVDGGERPADRPHRRRTAVIAAVAVAAVLGAVVLAVNLNSGGGKGTPDAQQAAGATTTHTGRTPSTSASPSKSADKKPGRTPSASAPGSASAPAPGKGGASKGPADSAASLNVATRPYVYDSPCSQHFLVDSAPAQVGPPAPTEQDAPKWAAAYGAVSADQQQVALTVQGTGSDTVVLEKLYVRILGKAAPLAWNDYSMGVGCGGNVNTKSFDIDLDNGSPTVTVKNGQRDFPYKVSETDPEVFYVTAHTKAHDVRWDLTLEWSSGSRHGTAHIDNNGTPFRTSAATGRPGYDYPLGYSEWIERTEQQ
ncbi:helix-turn-helix transcriptional regulator [Streptomyces sp. NPDC050264]|uniref:helix-turn-helix domain-containing protein n=1 Tax=Streptomyces sp. NPDC050264 TaxID=3155038 RepID=UPI003421520E